MIIIHNTLKTASRAIVVSGIYDNIHDLLLSILIQNPDLTVNNIKSSLRDDLILILDGFNLSNSSLINTQYLNRAKSFIAHFIKDDNVVATLV